MLTAPPPRSRPVSRAASPTSLRPSPTSAPRRLSRPYRATPSLLLSSACTTPPAAPRRANPSPRHSSSARAARLAVAAVGDHGAGSPQWGGLRDIGWVPTPVTSCLRWSPRQRRRQLGRLSFLPTAPLLATYPTPAPCRTTARFPRSTLFLTHFLSPHDPSRPRVGSSLPLVRGASSPCAA